MLTVILCSALALWVIVSSVATLILGVSAASITISFCAFWVIVSVAGTAILAGYRRIKADPKEAGIRTRFGKPTGKVDGSGWHFYAGYPFLDGFISVDARELPKTVTVKVNTPDKVPLEIEVNVTYRFDKENPLTFLDIGGHEGAFKSLTDSIEERVREWSISKTEGPQTWEEARAASDEAEAVILKAILGDDLPAIPGSIPTPPLLRYFAGKDPYNKVWGEKWERLKAEIKKLGVSGEANLKEAIEERRKTLRSVRDGKGSLEKKSLGIVICRLGIGNVKVPPEIENAAKEKPAAELKKEAARVKNETDEQNTKSLETRVESLKSHVGGDGKAALDAILTKDGVVKREIKETRVSVDPDTLKGVGDILAPIILGLFAKAQAKPRPRQRKRKVAK